MSDIRNPLVVADPQALVPDGTARISKKSRKPLVEAV